MENRAPQMSMTDWESLLNANFAGWSTMDPANVRDQYEDAPTSYFVDLGALYRGFQQYAEGAAKALEADTSFELTLKELLTVYRSEGSDVATTVDICTVKVLLKGEDKPRIFDCRHTAVWRFHPERSRWLLVHEHQSVPQH